MIVCYVAIVLLVKTIQYSDSGLVIQRQRSISLFVVDFRCKEFRWIEITK